MKKFHFSLESLLTYRIFLERKAKEDVVSALGDIRKCEQTIVDFMQEHKKTFGLLDKETDAGIGVEKFRLYNEYLEDLEREVKEAEKQLVQLKNKLLEKQEILKQRAMQKKILEKVKDLKKEEYDKEVLDMLQKEADDMISLKKAREIIEK
ncbi:MAG: flagellar export protein FliJ [Desulfobacteraceae bacterium 4572_19]|nr:MAG: flagellar export protein FliJ [Desulfobacteraceae bacterium 4572_19]